jgi:hypothetical protein
MIGIPSGVYAANRYSIRRVAGSWPFANANKVEIERHWAKRTTENPNYFNGRVYIMPEAALNGGLLTGTVLEIGFADTIYWRDTGFADASAVDCFGSAILRGSDGSLIYARQSPGHANSGFVYPPSGFLDPKDVDEDGAVDLDRSIYRELFEETGYRPQAGERQPGYIVTRDGPFLTLSIVFQLSCSGEEFREKLSSHLAQSAERELEAMVVLKDVAALAQHNISPYAKRLALALLGGRS